MCDIQRREGGREEWIERRKMNAQERTNSEWAGADVVTLHGLVSCGRFTTQMAPESSNWVLQTEKGSTHKGTILFVKWFFVL